MPSNEVDEALAAPIPQVGERLLALHEDQWFDRKSVRIAPRDLAKALVAFANAEGGTVVVGLSDGAVEGMKTHRSKLNDFRQTPMDHTIPPVRARFDQQGCLNSNGAADTLLVIRIDPSEVVHKLANDEVYLRVGDESRRLSFAHRQELEFDKGQSQYDGRAVPDVQVADLDADLISNYRSRTGAKGTTQKLLAARSLLTHKKELTNAGYLLFAPYPQQLFPQAYIRIIKFLTTERGTGARLGIEDDLDIRVEGPIPRAIQEASRVMEELVPKRRSLDASGLFESRPIVPRDAYLEGLVNAVIHRSYSLAGDHIRVEIYPDRIEIESPGRFPGLANPTAPLEISRFARNPRIARVCADLRIGQELGEGIKRIFEEMRLVGLNDPVYKQGAGSVRLILATVPRLGPTQAMRLPTGSQQILEVLRVAGKGLGTGEISEAISLSRPATTKRLRALQGEGLVTWSGKSARDPRAEWSLA
ncbi:putative DNA binding domain-containing protein [Aeromicrobium sp. CFBP 8757]|uniref:ATP-binding protein n=1 Tax=Aeromicrobium sp. CFBP 8757 TaxID=2775288 RepID=UPI0017872094|nr:ATP-binding protein [Aeromicrobium sp. CFBP 8757]MBD8605476.1 putative DNA binding domain-containing protein [Aeromicrobium sp. CFBP 8757]